MKLKRKLAEFLCSFLGHVPTDVDYGKRTAHCVKCGRALEIVYDMCYGDTFMCAKFKEAIVINAV